MDTIVLFLYLFKDFNHNNLKSLLGIYFVFIIKNTKNVIIIHFGNELRH